MANMCVSEKGYKKAEGDRFAAVRTAANYKAGIAAAQFLLHANDASSNFKKLNKVSSRGVTVEERLQKQLRETYWPAEDQMLDEYTQKTEWESQAVLAKRYAGRLYAPFAAQYAKEMHRLECEKPRYCTNSHVKRVQEMHVLRSAVRANVTLLADKIAFSEVQAIEATDHERRKQALAQRKGLVAQAAALMASAAQGFAGTAANSMAAVNGAIQTFGAAITQRQQAEAGFGRDPFFHQQIGQQVGRMAPVVDMAPQRNAVPDNFESDWERMTAGMNSGVATSSGITTPFGASEPDRLAATEVRDDTYSPY